MPEKDLNILASAIGSITEIRDGLLNAQTRKATLGKLMVEQKLTFTAFEGTKIYSSDRGKEQGGIWENFRGFC